MKKILILLLSVVSISASAQIGTLGYVTNMPLGDYKDYVGDFSWQGVEFGFGQYLGESNLAVGVEYRWYKMYEKKDRGTYHIDGGAITTTIYSYSFVNNINVYLRYFGDENGGFKPFGGLSMGPVYVKNTLVVGIAEVNDYNWKFSINPELGVIYRIPDRDTGISFKVNYNYIPYSYQNFSGISTLGFTLGVIGPF